MVTYEDIVKVVDDIYDRNKKWEATINSYIDQSGEEYAYITIYGTHGLILRMGKYIQYFGSHLCLYSRPIIRIAVNIKRGAFYETIGRYRYPLMITRCIAWRIRSDRRFRELFLHIFLLYKEQIPIFDELVMSLQKDCFIGLDVYINQIAAAQDKNDLFKNVISSKLPLDYNEISILDGLLISSMEEHIREEEYSIFAKVVRTDEATNILMQAKESMQSDYRVWNKSYIYGVTSCMVSWLCKQHYENKGITQDQDLINEYYNLLWEEGIENVSFMFTCEEQLRQGIDELISSHNTRRLQFVLEDYKKYIQTMGEE